MARGRVGSHCFLLLYIYSVPAGHIMGRMTCVIHPTPTCLGLIVGVFHCCFNLRPQRSSLLLFPFWNFLCSWEQLCTSSNSLPSVRNSTATTARPKSLKAPRPPSEYKRTIGKNKKKVLQVYHSRLEDQLKQDQPEIVTIKAPTAAGTAKPKKPKRKLVGTPLQRFKEQTKDRKRELHKARKEIDKELKAIEKDLGVFKRQKNPQYRPEK